MSPRVGHWRAPQGGTAVPRCTRRRCHGAVDLRCAIWTTKPEGLAGVLVGLALPTHGVHTFIWSAASFIAQFVPVLLHGALLGKMMEESGLVTEIADR